MYERKKARTKARKFMKQHRLKPKQLSAETLRQAAAQMGYEVCYFNPNDDRQITLLQKLTGNRFHPMQKAFSCEINGKRAIYLSAFTSENDKIFLLLHELAHAYLNHHSRSDMTDTAKEIQANSFAESVLGNNVSNRLIPLFTAGLTALIVSAGLCLSPSVRITEPPAPSEPALSSPSSQTVYITKTGTKYHRAACYHISGKPSVSVSLTEAVSLGYDPCKTCRPND